MNMHDVRALNIEMQMRALFDNLLAQGELDAGGVLHLSLSPGTRENYQSTLRAMFKSAKLRRQFECIEAVMALLRSYEAKKEHIAERFKGLRRLPGAWTTPPPADPEVHEELSIALEMVINTARSLR